MSDPATETAADWSAPDAKDSLPESGFSLEPNQMVWGLSSCLALTYGYLIRTWYSNDIKEDNIKFPDTNGTAVSETWALATREIAAWDDASTQMLLIQGLGVIFWGVNLALGQSGNLPHKLFYIASQALRVGPLVSLYHALKIQRQYLPNGAVYAQEVLLASSVPN